MEELAAAVEQPFMIELLSNHTHYPAVGRLSSHRRPFFVQQ